MQKLTKKRLFLYSLLISVWIYVAIRVVWFMASEVGGNTIALLAAYLSLALLVAPVGYLLLHRKVAAAAAGSIAFLLMGIHSLAMSLAGVLPGGLLFLALSIVIGAGVFYGWYVLLTKVKRPWLMVCVGLAISVIVGVTLSLWALYIERASFDV